MKFDGFDSHTKLSETRQQTSPKLSLLTTVCLISIEKLPLDHQYGCLILTISTLILKFELHSQKKTDLQLTPPTYGYAVFINDFC